MIKTELKALMAKHEDRLEDLAAFLNISIMTLSAKVNGKTEFKRSEIESIALRYNLPAEDIQKVFFALTVAGKEDTNTKSVH